MNVITRIHEQLGSLIIMVADPNNTDSQSQKDMLQDIPMKIYAYLAANLMSLVYAILIFAIGKWIAKKLSIIIEKTLNKANIDKTLSNFARSMVYIGIMAFVIIAALKKAGVEVASFAVVIGAAGLAIGMALQGSLSNFASGVLLIIFKPFRVEDFVEIGGIKGVVKEIEIFNTVLNTPDNIKVIVPNSQVTGGHITNYTAHDKRRVDLVIGVSYEDDLQKTRKVITEVLESDERVLKDPAPQVAVSELADSSVNFVVRPWCKTSEYWDVYFGLTEKIKVALDKNGISIPYPQQDVHLYKKA